jgi:hypothetical protein
MRLRLIQPWLRLWGCLAGAGLILACRYSVRDTGFIDLASAGGSYRLELMAPPDFSPAARRSLEQAAAVMLMDANITLETGGPTRPGEPASLRLVDSEGRPLTVATLTNATENFLPLIESIATSPLRDQLYRESLRAYGLILLIEGSDAADNQRARNAAQSAIDATAKLMPGMPKPVDVPPQLVVLGRAAQAAESILIWGLGFEPTPSDQPRLALLYGRGRRLGSTLEGPLITQTALRERLVLIGQDCECDLDRAWLRGPLYPGRWDRSLQEVATKVLGFDPENPMVRAEVSRIVERGPQPGQRRKSAGTAQALGYAEEAVESPAAPADETDPSDPSDRSDPPRRGPWYFLGGASLAALVAGASLYFRSRSH